MGRIEAVRQDFVKNQRKNNSEWGTCRLAEKSPEMEK